MRRRCLSAIATAALVLACAPGAVASAPATPSCGVDAADDGMGGKVFLSAITQRRNISCATARVVVRGAKRRGARLFACGNQRRTINGWKVRHTGPRYALSSRWTKGKRSFVFGEQGSC